MTRVRKPNIVPSEKLSVAAAGWYLGKTYNQVARLIALGHLQATRVNGRWQIRGEHVNRYLHNQRTAS